jgi:AraC family transcriptional regulator, transcriptional activator of pobA
VAAMAPFSEHAPAWRDGRGVRFVGYPRDGGTPAIAVRRHVGLAAAVPGPHAHDFLVLLYLEHGTEVVRVDGRDRALRTGDAFVVAPGAVVAAPRPGDGDARAWTVFFPADAVDPAAPLVSWRTHPLLAPFGGDHGGGGRRLPVPADQRGGWLAGLTDLDAELRERRDGYADAARAHLTLLLVRLGRLHRDAPPEPGVAPLLAAVFEVVEARYREPISLRDVADAVGLTAGHLTTVVGRRTGRTVQQWITERRMREARRLLADTDLTVAEIARRVGYREAGYFVRRFRTAHGVPPEAWRRAGRRPAAGVEGDPVRAPARRPAAR